jgi:L-threonylcarbamoyladenylate synthase
MPRCLKIDSSHPDAAVLQDALAVLRQGGVVAYPTDTVYGLAVDAMSPQAVARLYRVKRRPPDKAIPLIVGGLDQLSPLIAPPSSAAKRMMAVFWPGPLTLLMPAHEQAPRHLLGEGRRIGVRWPQIVLSQQLAYGLGRAITATSANLAGLPAALCASEVVDQLASAVDLVLDGGVAQSTAVSTILDVGLHPPRLCRPGRLSREEIEAALGYAVMQDMNPL